MRTIVVNDQVIECNDGNISIRVTGGKTRVTIDGVAVDIGDGAIVTIVGNCGAINCSGSVTVQGPVHGNVECGGSCDCGDVDGDVDAGGSIRAANVSGNMDAGGSIHIARR